MIYDSDMTQTTDRLALLNEAQARQADRDHRPVIVLVEAGFTQSDVARKMGLSRQRVSQIVLRAKARGLLP